MSMMNNGQENPNVEIGKAVPDFPVIGLPMHFQISQMEVNGPGEDGNPKASMGILLVIYTPVGTHKFLMPADGAAAFFSEGIKMASAAKAGIIIPPGHGG